MAHAALWNKSREDAVREVISRRMALFYVVAAVLGGGVVAVSAQANRVEVPTDYMTGYVLYDKVDKPDRKIIRFLYISPQAASLRDAGRPLPNGTVLVMEDHAAETDASGGVITGSDGRLIATSRITAIAVMEKRDGWGASIPVERRNGDWDYGAFDGAGQRRNVSTDPCFACHLPHGARDYTFTTLTRPIN
jgi:hypothetical protein